MKKESLIRVIIADDDNLVRQGIRALLEKADGIEVLAEAADGQQAVDLVEQLSPDVLVLDIAMPRLSGLQAVEHISKMGVETQVVMLLMYSDETVVHQALKNGAKGYLIKRSVTEELLLAIRAACQDEIYLSPAISRAVIDGFLTVQEIAGTSNPVERLTPREREVLQLVAEGHTNVSIASLLSISIKTVEKHRANLMSKLNVHNLAALIRIAIKYNLIFIDQ